MMNEMMAHDDKFDAKSRCLGEIIKKLNLAESEIKSESTCCEGYYLEFKEISDSAKNGNVKDYKDLCKTIVAMLNADGGLICCGFKERSGDDGIKYYIPVGFKNDVHFNEFANEVVGRLRNKCFISYVSGNFSEKEIGMLLGKGKISEIKEFRKFHIRRIRDAGTEFSVVGDSFFIDSYKVSGKLCAFIFIPPLLKSYKPAFLAVI